MKKKILFFVILVGVLVLGAVVKNSFFTKKREEGTLRVSSSPEASVFVNSMVIGKTPFRDKLKTGEYLIKLIPEGEATSGRFPMLTWNWVALMFPPLERFLRWIR